MQSPLDQFIESVTVPSTVDIRCWEPDLFIGGNSFMEYLVKTFDSFDVLTYTHTPFGGRLNINRLITYQRVTKASGLRYKQHRIRKDHHCKLFICYKNGKPGAVYVGSQNLTSGWNINIMYKVRAEHSLALVNFFNQMWKF